MQCPYCGADQTNSGRFCPSCGGDLAAYRYPAQPAPAYSQPIYQAPVQYAFQAPKAEPVRENMPMGILGALLGCLIGAVTIVLFLQANLLSWISGLLISFCTVKGYELLGKKVSNRGVIICIVLLVVVPLVSYFIGITISTMNSLEKSGIYLSFSKTLSHVIDYAKERPGLYLRDLFLIYLFVVLGSAGTLYNAYEKNKRQNR